MARLAFIAFACAAALWYAHNQLLYSLYFFYQVAAYFWPGVFPPLQ